MCWNIKLRTCISNEKNSSTLTSVSLSRDPNDSDRSGENVKGPVLKVQQARHLVVCLGHCVRNSNKHTRIRLQLSNNSDQIM